MENYFYVAANGEQAGPVSGENLKQCGVTKETLVWCSGMADWEKAGNVSELKPLFEEVPPIPSVSPVPPVPSSPASTVSPGNSFATSVVWDKGRVNTAFQQQPKWMPKPNASTLELRHRNTNVTTTKGIFCIPKLYHKTSSIWEEFTLPITKRMLIATWPTVVPPSGLMLTNCPKAQG